MTTHKPVAKMSRVPNWIIVLSALLALPTFFALHVLISWIKYDPESDGHQLLVPDAFGVEKVLYAAEKNWGAGPGGNETGILVYEMPEATAAVLQRQGLEYLQALPVKSRRTNLFARHPWKYENWRKTPLEIDRDWSSEFQLSPRKEWGEPDVADYMDRYGFGIPVDDQVKRFANGAIRTPGNYYAYSRNGGGLIILMPAAHRIILVYAG